MKQIVRLLFDANTQELLAFAGMVGAILSALLPGSSTTIREILTAVLGFIAASGGVSDAVVKTSENRAAGVVSAAKIEVQASAQTAHMADSAQALMASLGMGAPAAPAPPG